MKKKKLLVSFSGGETSAYMSWWLWNNRRDEYDMIFVFVNTGQENEETLIFIQLCTIHFGFPVVWIEAKVIPTKGVGNYFKIVNYLTASRNGEPFEEIIKKHGIPNMSSPHCTRELKQTPIKAYAKHIWGNDYEMAIGIRNDEIDRKNYKASQLRIIYPLISKAMCPMTKPDINLFWSKQPFRLQLKGYQGNCRACWKKSTVKLYQIAREDPSALAWVSKMENKYGEFIPESRLKKLIERGELPEKYFPITFFRGKKSAIDIAREASLYKGGEPIDDSEIYPPVDLFPSPSETIDMDGESCEPFSTCQP